MDFLNIGIMIVFSLIALWLGWRYFFGKQRFTPWNLLGAIWSASIAVSQLRLSSLEQQWGLWFWVIVAAFFIVFAIGIYFSRRWWMRVIPEREMSVIVRDSWFLTALVIMTLTALATNGYIYNHFGTLPILSTIPDKMRFIINREIFGLWEYIALLPRIVIPFSILYLLFTHTKKWWHRAIAIGVIVIGFVILSLYAARLLLIFPILLSYFSYLITRVRTITFKKMVIASLLAAFLVLSLSVAIPGVRQYITYKDYYEKGGDPFNYIVDISHIEVPKMFSWVVPLYIVPAFNLQTLSRSAEYITWPHFFWGTVELSPVTPLFRLVGITTLNATIPWDTIFLSWWVTATFLFPYWADFGLVGIIVAAIIWALFLSGVYTWALRRPSYGSIMLFSYASFIVFMSIYSNYFLRSEVYLDIVVIGVLSYILSRKTKNIE